ncbi:AAA family ATPase [Candidatus Nitrotoga sp. 1052]|uniref:AAA family ATPase n=1 Tax=Candidatus Nitrotoga sp. 1052 TaxID=2886964 RepID=UPI001EF4BA94|nr:AAA family ATPase [Candidatus Nitrotoga sp. 1052]CAH1088056.1 Predicted ATP-dependent endonuclease of the OLD family, contains P-loop ATPase and TOPRIM domains [Candidatus Nitrotoga sp. 1052]
MRLKSVFISQYKNLKNFSLNFDGASFIDVFVGKNGSGKSNLFEALIEIFRHLYEFDNKGKIGFEYAVKYEISGTETEIAWKDGNLSVNGKVRKAIGDTPLPDNVLIYYSGHNDTVATLVQQYESAFRKRIRKADFDESRRFIGIGSEYKALLLAVLLMQKADNKAREFICKKLGIDQLGIRKPGGKELTEAVVKLVLERPVYANGARFDIKNNDESDQYWRPEGITKTFLKRLTKCIVHTPGKMTVTEGYLASDDRYILYFSIAKIQQEFTDYSAQVLFRQFDNLKTLGMLADIAIPLTLTSGLDATIAHFSDGQFQSVYIYSIVELFKDRNCLTLLDEPDAFLHPEWQFDFLRQVIEITDTANNNHVLMSSHSAATLCSLDEQNISLFKIENSVVSCSKRSKKEVIRELSDSFIQYSEDESKLLIDNVIRSSPRPILFVEGTSDVSILNTAYTKLYPNTDIPILIQDAFDRGFIKVLLARDALCNTYPDKQFFALFDFDEAYDDWRQLGGEHQVTDITRGLCRKLPDKNVHSFMLPIPNNQLKAQVWDETNPNEKIKPKPHFCAEHLFWGAQGLDQWFKTDAKTGLIKFKGDKHKVKFAKEVVPTLDVTCFEVLRPMFEFIKSKCQLSV